ncbi:unnamed protein product [Adineta steineri]|uniref:Uncharacterized protein n=1 Tax=Adineta steineri TaxID=433720 RepID=A0A814X8V7_9BILA|nr:unnamed protein product [Adineta steineri]CAF1208073.1 unnamed protein product [Adineta steineri]CAF3929910.1 unnamed protein product [Adineta steineri]CAF4176403.1 unnamed protein product [Adineta steineri]
MESEIYRACRYNDINYVQALIETSSNDTDINQLESNGSTALHFVCSKGYTNIARLLLNDYRVDRHRTDRNGQTAYQIASTEEIRQLFSRDRYSDNPFCTNQNTLNPLVVFTNEDNSPDSQYTTLYPSEGPIMTECLHRVYTDDYNTVTLPIINQIRRFFGNDPEKNKIDKWVENLRIHIEQCFIVQNYELNSTTYLNAYKCIEDYYKTRNIEYLLKLYTLHKFICEYFSQDSIKTDYLYEPISFHLSNLSERAYQGLCFRGLTMNEKEFKKYKQAFYSKRSYIKTNTFCSTSIDPAVAEMFTNPNNIQGTINVMIMFDFVRSCSTAIVLFSSSSQLKCISHYEEEKEVLILPGTIFSVKNIQEDNQAQFITIHLEKFDTTEIENEMYQERFQNYVDTFTDF